MSKNIIYTISLLLFGSSLQAITLKNQTGQHPIKVQLFGQSAEHQNNKIFINDTSHIAENGGTEVISLVSAFDDIKHYIGDTDMTVEVNLSAYAGQAPVEDQIAFCHLFLITKDTNIKNADRTKFTIHPGTNQCVRS